jgi:hypothetical protein
MKSHLVLVIMCFYLIGCRPLIETPIPEDCRISVLLLDLSIFPKGTTSGRILSPLPDGSKESGGIDFYYHGNNVIHTVNNYFTIKNAIKGYKKETSWIFTEGKDRGPWERPDITFSSEYADNLEYLCGFVVDEYKCEMTARYGVYYSWFAIDISGVSLSLVDFERGMIEIDKRMGRCMNKYD